MLSIGVQWNPDGIHCWIYQWTRMARYPREVNRAVLPDSINARSIEEALELVAQWIAREYNQPARQGGEDRP